VLQEKGITSTSLVIKGRKGEEEEGNLRSLKHREGRLRKRGWSLVSSFIYLFIRGEKWGEFLFWGLKRIRGNGASPPPWGRGKGGKGKNFPS